MTAKQFMQRAYRLDNQVTSKLEQIERLRAIATQTTNALQPDKVQSGRVSDKISSCIAKLVDLENEVTADIDSLVDTKREIARVIALVEKENQRVLLEMRYLSFYPWEKVAVEMRYNYHYVTHELHSAALKSVNIHLNLPIDM